MLIGRKKTRERMSWEVASFVCGAYSVKMTHKVDKGQTEDSPACKLDQMDILGMYRADDKLKFSRSERTVCI